MSSLSSHQPEKIPKLYDFLSLEDIDKLRNHFQKQKSGGLSYEKFRAVVKRYGVVYSDDVFPNLCLRIDLDRDNVIKWSEFTSYILLEMQIEESMRKKLSIIPPIPKPANVLSTTQRSAVVRILFANGESDEQGYYATINSFGEFNVWSSEWKLEMSRRVDEIPNSSSSTIELSDKQQIKNSPKTLITDAVVLTDLKIICISSVSCDLRFYDFATVAKCNLRIYIRSFPSPLISFHYHCATDDDDDSKLIFGDMLGSVRVIHFMKGFKSQIREGSTMRQISYYDLIKGKNKIIACSEFIKIHHDIVRQVSFVKSMNSFISASESVVTKSAYLPSVIIGNLDAQESQIVFRMNSGTTCFAFDETSKTLATGGPDCILRLWTPITPSQPKTILSGHTSGIIQVFMQDNVSKIFSLDQQKSIKVWDVHEEQQLQTFTGLKSIFIEDVPVTTYYNDSLREFVVASKKIVTIKCQPKINLSKTDGFTDMSPVTLVLLNELFNFLVTCSEASMIIVWDVWKGHKVNLITQAHTREKHGENQLVAITAGCFDPKHQFLLTVGGRTLKVWNFNEGICLRTITIEGSRNVRDIFWTSKRIFAISESVTEFFDNNNYKEQINLGKAWLRCHQGEIICASVREPEAVVTSCTEGDLIFWNFETGRPFLRFNVKYPSRRLQIVYYDGMKNEKLKPEERRMTKTKRKSLHLSDSKSPQQSLVSPTSNCMLSLNHRPVDASNGTLLVSLSSGRVQVWSHHHTSDGYIADFNAIHVAGDVITAMTTDTRNCYLFTGSAEGFIKTWMIVNFCLSTSVVEKISPVKLRQLFPFLSRDDLEGRAKQSVKNQLEPQLLNSYQGHRKLISGLIYHEANQVLISSSRDKSVRLWNLSGQYIGTIGSPVNWHSLSPNEALPHDYAYRIPADLKHVVSYTTLKVLEGGHIPSLNSRNMKELQALDDSDVKRNDETELAEAAQPLLHFHKPVVKKDPRTEAQRRYEKPTLDISLPHIPVYSHLRIHPTVAINLPHSIPKCLETNNLPNLRYMFLEPDELKTEK